MWSYPYMDLLPTALESLEYLDTNWLRVTLGLPKRTQNISVYTEAQALPLPFIATQRLLQEILRLGESYAGCGLIARLWSCPLFHSVISLNTLAFLN